MPRGRARGVAALIWRPLVVLAVAGVLAWWILRDGGPRREPVGPTPPVVADAPPRPEPPVWRPRPRAEPAPGCRPRAEARCIGGDPWWHDSCGVANDKVEDCGLAACVDGACEPVPGCGDLTAIGRCEGDLARACAAGHPVDVDCAAEGKRCVMTEDGPACRLRTEDDCDWPAKATRCEGETLLACHEGALLRVDCLALGARCTTTMPGLARCVDERPPAIADAECGPCGCEPGADGREVCDGRDNDGDGWIDEHGCDPVDVVAFVIGDDRGEASYSQEEIDEEIARVNAAFSREDDYGLSFRLVDTLLVADSALLELDEPEYDDLIERMAYPEREAFYVPILFTDEVLIDDVPRPGASTVPNGMCGGKRRLPGPQPAIGVVAIAKRRWATTVAHEIGHFLGLCHTHGDHVDAVQTVVRDEDGEAESCEPSCVLEADGICDTPPDPGPEACTVHDDCSLACATGETPDAKNLMGYYPECRAIFSEQQALLMRRVLALRRGWHPCLFGDGCACEPTGGCPEQMSCRQLERGAGELVLRCGMDGHAVPGGACRGGGDCSLHSQCMSLPHGASVCVRICAADAPDCTCTELAGNPWPICVEDIRSPAATATREGIESTIESLGP